MSYTSEHLAALQSALASGALTVRHADGKMVTYRSIKDLKEAIAVVEGELADQAGTPRYNRSFARFSKG